MLQDVTEVNNTTGVHGNSTGDVFGNSTDDVTIKENNYITGVHGNSTHNIEIDDDDLSIEHEEHDDNNHVTINDLSTIKQMNTAQINTDQKRVTKQHRAGDLSQTMAIV